MRHLTRTGMNAGMTLCGGERTGNDGRKVAAKKEYQASPEYVALHVCIAQAHRNGVKPGREVVEVYRKAKRWHYAW